MATPPRTDEACTRCAQIWLSSDENFTEGALSAGMDRMTFKRHVEEAFARGLIVKDGVLPGFSIRSISTQYDAGGNEKGKSVRQAPAPDGQFAVPDGHRITGVSSYLDANGNVAAQWVKTRSEPDPAEVAKVVAEAVAAFEYYPIGSVPEPVTDPDLATVYALADWHVDLLAWGRETGEDWDTTIAQADIMAGVRRVMASSPNSAVGVVLGLGDMLHADGFEPFTSRSKNVLDVDGRYPKVLRAAADMVTETVALALQKHETVIVRVLPGNHDDQSAFALSLALSMKFADHPRVSFDDAPSRLWWWRWGKTFLGAAHGDRAKMQDLPMMMAVDRPHDWAASTFRKIFTGHVHHESKREHGGVIVESLRAPIHKDAFHAAERYRSGRSLYSETFSKSGEMATRVQVNL